MKNGKYVEPNGTQFWYKDGKIHREDGPAIIYPDERQIWYKDDIGITNQVINWSKERNIDLNNISTHDKLILKLEMKMW